MLKGYKQLEDIDIHHNELHRKLFAFGFPILETVATTAPTTDTLESGYGQWYESGDVRRLYYNLNGTIIYQAWTNG